LVTPKSSLATKMLVIPIECYESVLTFDFYFWSKIELFFKQIAYSKVFLEKNNDEGIGIGCFRTGW
jgi:hypothetical protein